MLFSSPVFLFAFLPAVLGLYYLSAPGLRNALLLLASLFFYAWGEPALIVVMLFSITMNYMLGLAVDRTRGQWLGKALLALAVVMNLGLLVYFKYASFLIDNLNALLGLSGAAPLFWPHVVMPIGISFYTFQALSYVIDVYRRDGKVLRNPITMALYKSLFPQLIAGPIVRYVDVADQMHDRPVSLDRFAEGVKRFVTGLGKKMIVANSVAAVADAVFQIPQDHLSLSVAWLGIVCYTLQIYFDFSGYSDMAIGLGRMFGFTFLENFNYPYVASSITEFWRRWHISLSSWLRDYLYIPLGGSRCAAWRVYLNLLIVFLLCGLWHGASWNFVAWGLFHGFFLVIERLGLGRLLAWCWRPLRHAYVLLTVMVGWVFFRAEHLPQACGYLKAMLGCGAAASLEYPLALYLDRGLMLILLIGCLGSLPLLPWLQHAAEQALARWRDQPWRRVALEGCLALGQTFVLAMALLASASMMLAATYNPFIYFRF